MIYLLKNPYTEKLYNKIKMSVVNLSLITIDLIEHLQLEDILVLDAEDKYLIEVADIKMENVILLGESDDDYRVISKYQSIDRIKSLISDQFFPLYFCTSLELLSITETQMYDIAEKYAIEYLICLNHRVDSEFSLFKWCMEGEAKLTRKEIIYVINNINDLRFEPSVEVLNLIESTRKKGNTMVFSFPLKSQLDFKILDTSNIIIAIFKDKVIEHHLFDNHLHSKIIQVIIDREGIKYFDSK